MKITLTNDNHNTSINLVAKNGKLSESQIKRAKRTLCCFDCCCSDDFGTRGRQDGFELEPTYDGYRGCVDGAYVHMDEV